LANFSGRFVRWQTTQITQFGFVQNLVLGFAMAGLGLWVSLLRDVGFQPHCWAKCLFSLSAFSFISSIGTGILCSLNRLWDFRISKDISGGKWDGAELGAMRIMSDKLGDRTWMLLYLELVTFIFAISLLMGALVVSYWSKLF
jgi:hypothetical protein